MIVREKERRESERERERENEREEKKNKREMAYLWIIWLNRESVCKISSPVTTVSFVLSSFFATRVDLRLSSSSRIFCVRDTIHHCIFAALSHAHVICARLRATAVICELIN
ncbi:hypothetical protein P5V15_001782 [Pogonomyrmex californicus]